MGQEGRGLHDQQLSIDQRLKNCTLKKSFDFQILRSKRSRNA